MRVLITGCSGSIGRMQVQTARQAGHEVRTFDRIAGKREDDWEHIPGDLRDLMAVRKAVQGMDAVLHLGAISNDGRGLPEEILSVNVQGTWNILLACVEAGVDRVVYYSSVNSLGNFQGFRAAEYVPIDDATPRQPMSPYQLSKHLGEETCRSFSNSRGIVTVCLRPVWVTPPDHYAHWRERRANADPAWSKGDYWSYVDMRDVCAAALLGLTVENITHDAFLLAAEDTMFDIPTAELMERYYPDTPWRQNREAYLAENPYRSLVDCTHARQKLGWQPQHSWRREEGRGKREENSL